MWIIAYPHASDPILIKVDDPTVTAWLPANPELDYAISKNKKSGKWMVSSPGLGFSKYVPRPVDHFVCFLFSFGTHAWIHGLKHIIQIRLSVLRALPTILPTLAKSSCRLTTLQSPSNHRVRREAQAEAEAALLRTIILWKL